ncbi:hypothetical protein RHGRI_010099 [Rhododendron griersonianum]|uniref:TF-B3 domain-containing protein n=1 Tax=Rhododendron griersonianum TaxID=479676 RepID=A0AAV6KH67_9ERIC|nr:hypothetical protein RHGRI_010099 [Rhododendron griersonianum]
MKLSRDGLLSPPSTSATCGSGEKPTDATIHACRPTKSLNAIRAVLESLEDQLEFFHVRRHSFSGGWRSFVVDNGLKEGDACIFELVKRAEMQVHVFRAGKRLSLLSEM